MSKLAQGRPQTTSSPQLTIDPGLAPGRHRFQLVVIDSSGNRSLADAVTVEIRKTSPEKPRNK